MFNFELSDGRVVVWRPLKLGQRQDTIAALSNSNGAELARALYMARIISINGEPFNGSRKAWGDWDDLDYDAFVEEVDIKENARRSALSAKKTGGATSDVLRQRIEVAQAKASELAIALGEVLSVLTTLESQRDPLDSPQK